MTGTVPLRESTALETYVDTRDPLSPDARLELQVPQLADVQGRIEAFVGTGPRDLPLIVRAPHGFGEIVFVAFDLDEPPLAGWAALPQLFEKLLFRTAPGEDDEDTGPLGEVTTLGFVDLSGQLRGALDQFPGVRFVPFWFVAVLVVAYIVCIGPLDYYLVRHVFRRMEATWLSFTVMVLLFSAGAAALAYGLKGRELHINHIDLVDFDAEGSLVRGTNWSNIFSPRIETFDLALVPRDFSPRRPRPASCSPGLD